MNGKIIGSAITSFVLASGGVIVGVPLSGYAINKTTLLIGCVVGAMAAANDWRSRNALPPVTNENVQAMIAALNAKQNEPDK